MSQDPVPIDGAAAGALSLGDASSAPAREPSDPAPPDRPDAPPGARPASSDQPDVPPTPETPAAAIADGVMRSLDPRYVDLGRLIGRILSAIAAPSLLAGSTVLGLAFALPLWAVACLIGVAAAVACLLFVFLDRWPAVEHRHAAYRLDGTGIEIREGVVWRRTVSVPRSRVQHTDVSQGPIERRYGLATLTVHTAGTEEARVALPGLEHRTALAIRDHLVAAGGGDDAV